MEALSSGILPEAGVYTFMLMVTYLFKYINAG